MSNIKNLERLLNKLEKIKAGTTKEVEQVLDDAARKMYTTAVLQMGKVSQGRVYIINGKPHTASLPGDYPNVLTGALRNSLFWDLQRGKLTARFGVKGGLEYARYLEYGTSKMAPRPFIRPSYDKHYKDVAPSVSKIIQKVIRENKI